MCESTPRSALYTPHYLDLILIGARNLDLGDRITEVYVVISCGWELQEFVSSPVKSDGIEVGWNEDATFTLWDTTNDITFDVYDSRTQLIGAGSLSLGILDDEVIHYIDISLKVPDRAFPNGHLSIVVQYTSSFEKMKTSMLSYLGLPSEMLPCRMATGDILLFDNSELMPHITKLFTLSAWDHVAMVVEKEHYLCIFEVTHPEGVGLYNLDRRIEYSRRFCNKIGVRRLCYFGRPIERFVSNRPQKNKFRTSNYFQHSDVKKEGYMTKEGQIRKNWKRRYFVLTGSSLFYFRSYLGGAAVKPKGVIPLAGASVLPTPASPKPHAFCVQSTQRCLNIFADSDEQMHEWMEAISAVARSSTEQAEDRFFETSGADDINGALAMPLARKPKVDPATIDHRRLLSFISEVNGRPYQTNVLEMLRGLYSTGTKSPEEEERRLQRLFCSELVAAAYQAMGILPKEDKNAEGYVPKDFSLSVNLSHHTHLGGIICFPRPGTKHLRPQSSERRCASSAGFRVTSRSQAEAD